MSCSMGFGELNIPSSRAFWDDCDEDEVPAEQTGEKLQLTNQAGELVAPTATDLMLLIEGNNIVEFAEASLLREGVTKICDVPAKKSSLHTIEGTNTLLTILDEELTQSGEILELLLPHAKEARRVVTITIKPKVDYKSENIAQVRDEITFLRGVNSQLPHVKELEAPNFIAGVAAGVASWRSAMNLPVSSYVAYTDTMPVDSLTAGPILKLLHDDLGIDCARTYRSKQRDDSHLYL